jgi:hypothetical protein
MQKSKNGISLIALIITIIILLILAGISVTAVLGDNGIFKMSKKASDKTKDSSVVEELELAWTARLSEYLEEHSKNQKVTKSNFFTLDSLNNELTSGTVSNYKYKENGETSFTYTDNSTGTQYGVLVSSTGKATVMSRNEKTIEDSYLVDVVQIGDYVDIGVDYGNVMEFKSEYTLGGKELYGEKGPTGWRVLSKTGSGKNGYVTLVSAGTPLAFSIDDQDLFTMVDQNGNTWYFRNTENCILTMNNLYSDLNEYWDGSFYIYTTFDNILVTSDSIKLIFDSNKYTDTSKGIHALMVGTDIWGETKEEFNAIPEVEKLYKYIADEKDIHVISDFESVFSDAIGYQKSMFNSTELGLTLEDKTADLLCNGMCYFLGGCSNIIFENIGYDICVVDTSGKVAGIYDGIAGVRPVVTLKKGVQVSDDNTGNGYYGSPYTIKYDD